MELSSKCTGTLLSSFVPPGGLPDQHGLGRLLHSWTCSKKRIYSSAFYHELCESSIISSKRNSILPPH